MWVGYLFKMWYPTYQRLAANIEIEEKLGSGIGSVTCPEQVREKWSMGIFI